MQIPQNIQHKKFGVVQISEESVGRSTCQLANTGHNVELGSGEKTPVWFDRKVCLFVYRVAGLKGNPDKTYEKNLACSNC